MKALKPLTIHCKFSIFSKIIKFKQGSYIMRLAILAIFIFTICFNQLLFPQNQKAYVHLELTAELLTDSSFGGSGFNSAPDANRLQIGVNYPISQKIEAGATFAASFNAAKGADSLKYTAIGVHFLWAFAPRFQLVFNPEYAIIDQAGFVSWINVLFGLRYSVIPNLFDLKTHLNIIDGKNPMYGIGVLVRIK